MSGTIGTSYLEAGGYETYGPSLLSLTGSALGPGSTANVAPYARAAWQWDWNGQSAHVGALLLSANINPAISAFSANGSQGKNLYTDYALDAGYQYLGDGTNIGTAYMLLVHEDQDLKGSFNTGASSQASSNLNQLRMNTTVLLQKHLRADARLAIHLGQVESIAVRAGADHRQSHRQARQQCLHHRGRLDPVRQG